MLVFTYHFQQAIPQNMIVLLKNIYSCNNSWVYLIIFYILFSVSNLKGSREDFFFYYAEVKVTLLSRFQLEYEVR